MGATGPEGTQLCPSALSLGRLFSAENDQRPWFAGEREAGSSTGTEEALCSAPACESVKCCSPRGWRCSPERLVTRCRVARGPGRQELLRPVGARLVSAAWQGGGLSCQGPGTVPGDGQIWPVACLGLALPFPSYSSPPPTSALLPVSDSSAQTL